MEPYKKLAALYDAEWGVFSVKYSNFIRHLEKKFHFKPSSALDVACGTGGLAILLSKTITVDACDISPQMIEIAQSKSNDVHFFTCDMRTITTPKTYDLVICAFDSVNYLLGQDDLATAFISITKVLNKNGYFIFDVNTPNLYTSKHHGEIEREVNGQKIKQILEYDEKTGFPTTTFVFPDGSVEKHHQRAYTKGDAERILREANLVPIGVYENIDDFTPASDTSERIFFVAQRR